MDVWVPGRFGKKQITKVNISIFNNISYGIKRICIIKVLAAKCPHAQTAAPKLHVEEHETRI